MNILGIKAVEEHEIEIICGLPQNEYELYFMFPAAKWPLTVEQMSSAIKNRYDSTVITYDGEIAGFANFYEVAPNAYVSVGNVVVNPKFRKNGVGKYLIETMERIAKANYSVKEVRISCFNTNTRGLNFYHKLGYKPFDLEMKLNHKNEAVAFIKFRKSV